MDKYILIPETAEEELSFKQKNFCQEYLKDFNATAAARRSGYSADSAASVSCRLLKKPGIRAFIEKAQADKSNEVNMAGEAANVELVDLAFADRKAFFDEQGKLKPIQAMPEHLLSSLQISTTITTHHADGDARVTFTMPSKIQLLDKLSKRTPKSIFKTTDQEGPLRPEDCANYGNGDIRRM